jgi:hypothetical protein
MSDVVINVTDTPVPTVTVNATGTKGDTGPAGPAGGNPTAGEDTTAGEIGTTIAVAGFAAATDYAVWVSYSQDPGGNSALWYEKTATNFTVYHHGVNLVKFSYVVFPL